MKNHFVASMLFATLVATTVCSRVSAQEFPKLPGPVKEHEWLHQFVGEWESDMESAMGPGQPAMKCKGTMNSRMLGGFWVISESKADMMGQTMNGIQTIGYDPAKKKYVGTWVDNMMNLMWQYEGSVDSTGKILTLEAEGPNFMAEGKTTKFRDAYEFKSKDHIVATSSMLADGKWMTFMNGNIRRKK